MQPDSPLSAERGMTRCDFAMSVIGNPTHCELLKGHAGPHCYTAMLGNTVTYGGENAADVSALTARLTVLADALAFYADAANWKSPSKGFVAQYDPEPSPIAKDAGSLARAALEGQ